MLVSSQSAVTLCWAPVSTGIGDRLRAGKPPRFVTTHSGQLSLLPSAGSSLIWPYLCWKGMLNSNQPTNQPTFHRTENECQPNCGDAVAWELRQVWFIPLVDKRVGGRQTVWSLVNTCHTWAHRDEFLMIKRYTNLRLLYFTHTGRTIWLLWQCMTAWNALLENLHIRCSRVHKTCSFCNRHTVNV